MKKIIKWYKNPLLINLTYNRVRITTPLAHFLVSPLKRKFIVSYPRSGSTWIRTMLTNIIDPHSNSDPNIFNRIIPGTTLTRLKPVYHAPFPYTLSTHSTYRPNIKRVVYIVRNGKDSMLSLYRYTTVRIGINMDFDTWFTYYMRGWYGPRWDQHVESWLGEGLEKLNKKMLIIRYEDCCANPHDALKKVSDFLGIKHTINDINRAVDASTIDNMKKWERKLLGKIQNEDASFYRGYKKAKEWETLLSCHQRELFLNCSRSALQLAGYSHL